MVSGTVADITDTQAVLKHSPHYLSISPKVRWQLQIQSKRQLRLTTQTGKDGAYTLWAIHEDPDVDIRMAPTARDALGVEVGDTVDVATIVPTAADVATAREQSAVAESSDQHGNQLLIAAPHAGNIEPGTGTITERVHDAVRAEGIESSCWQLYTFGSNTFDRWHIHSSNLDPAAYPELRQIADKRYSMTLSVHGHSKDYISVGGCASQPVRQEMADSLSETLPTGTDIRFKHHNGVHMGTTGKNFVNWLRDGPAGGIQLEIPRQYRDEYLDQIVEGCVDCLHEISIS